MAIKAGASWRPRTMTAENQVASLGMAAVRKVIAPASPAFISGISGWIAVDMPWENVSFKVDHRPVSETDCLAIRPENRSRPLPLARASISWVSSFLPSFPVAASSATFAFDFPVAAASRS